MESKFKVGDRVYSDEYDNNGVIQSIHKDEPNNQYGFEVLFSFGNVWHVHEADDLSHYGQTVADLNVKAGDVVECVEWCGDLHNKGDVVTYGDECISRGAGLWRIISRASDTQWNPCEPDYTPQDSHEVSYYMGVATHWREVVAVEVDVDEPVYFDGSHLQYLTPKRNATLRGKALNGKPVGQWVIDMDERA
jgi:hypothetical protein